MARVLGKAGRFVSQQAGRREQQMLVVSFVVAGAVCWISGFEIGTLFHRNSVWFGLRAGIMINAISLGLFFVLWKWGNRQMTLLDKKRTELRKGARGEEWVSFILANLPDSFCVINDLATQNGNLDHVVIGPTGVFAIDTKSWRGI